MAKRQTANKRGVTSAIHPQHRFIMSAAGLIAAGAAVAWDAAYRQWAKAYVQETARKLSLRG